MPQSPTFDDRFIEVFENVAGMHLASLGPGVAPTRDIDLIWHLHVQAPVDRVAEAVVERRGA